MTVPTRILESIDGPVTAVFSVAQDRMGRGKDKDECTPDEIMWRFAYHALHVIERRLTDLAELPDDPRADRMDWADQKRMFEEMAAER